MSGSRQDVVCKILEKYGHFGSICCRYSWKHLQRSVEGSSGLFVESVTGMPQIVIRYRRDAIAQYSSRHCGINRVINTSFAESKVLTRSMKVIDGLTWL
ncbi:MAG: hypothetical protein U0T81_00330 [Saprospiraceae bacterium]